MVQSLRVWAIQGTNYTLPTHQGLRILAWLAYVLVSFDYHQEFVKSFLFKKTFFTNCRSCFIFNFLDGKIYQLAPKKKKREGEKFGMKKKGVYIRLIFLLKWKKMPNF
jgi:hypothetical protein